VELHEGAALALEVIEECCQTGKLFATALPVLVRTVIDGRLMHRTHDVLS